MNTRDDRVARLLAALTAAAGLSALVAFTGAVITWVRFQEAKLPADQAVAVAPNSALLAAGGVALVAFALIAGASVVIAYLIDSCGLPHDQLIGVIVLGGVGLAGAALFTEAPWSARWTAVAVVAFVVVGAVLVAVLLGDMTTAAWLKRHRGWLIGTGLLAAAVIALVIWLGLNEWLAALVLLAVAVLLVGAVWLATSESGDVFRPVLLVLAVAALAATLKLILDTWWIAALVPLVVLLAIGVLAVARGTGTKFRWYGAAVFVAVIVFGAVMNTLRTWEDPRLQPMALLFTTQVGGGGQSGLFVAQGGDRVYLGLVERCHRSPQDLVLRPGSPKGGTGQIVSIPRAQIAAESVGTVAALNTALARGPELLDQLAKRSGTPRSSVPAVPCADEGVLDQKVRDGQPADIPELAAQYRPVLKFDSDERWRPLNVDSFLLETIRGAPAQRLCDGEQEDDLHCTPITSPLQLPAEPNDPKAYVDLAGKQLGGDDYASPQLAECPSQPAGLKDCDDGPRSAIYYHAVDANGHYYVDYWWFLRYNRFEKSNANELCKSVLTRDSTCFDHEGDWEGVTLVLSKDDTKTDRVEFVNYAAHEGVFRYRPVQITRDGLRPVVYIANGSHAAYPFACPKGCKQVNKLFGHALPEDNTDGKGDWGRNADADALLPLPTGSWAAFAGFWGSRTCDDAFGSCTFGVPPRSPSQQRRFGSAWCYSGIGLRLTCDGKMPE
jgi:hypothetical protein